jgi:hypothetical protein
MTAASGVRFFHFMARYGIAWWFIEALPRKINGERGAPIAQNFGFAYAVAAPKVTAALTELQRRIDTAGRGKRGVDLQVRESCRAGYQVLLVDDLDDLGARDVTEWWPGASALLETSPGNYQTLLVSPEPLDRGGALISAQALARRFGGDSGAAQPGQLHRFPGSSNFKPACLHAGGAFETRLVALRDPEAPELVGSALREIVDGHRTSDVERAQRQATPARAEGAGKSNSELAISWAMREIARGQSDDYVLAGLGNEWLSHHDARDWPLRTLRKAKTYLGMG